MVEKKKKKSVEDKLSLKNESVWKGADKKTIKKIFDYAEGYKKFLGEVKTEREAVARIVAGAEKLGFRPLDSVKKLKAGDKVYVVNREKNAALIVIGKQPLSEGVNLVGAHIDAPRVDLKVHPLYEDSDGEMALFKTHYYGGIKKYQWVNIPLAIHGVIYTKEGKRVDMKIGEDDADEVFVFADLLPHLARKAQGDRKGTAVIEGEELNLLVGSMPIDDKETKEKIKTNILKILNERFGITEEDFLRAELEIVPAWKARDVGFDRSIVGGYGQDDRICGYTSFTAITEVKNPKRTAISLFFDKEEIGSDGNTGAQSDFLVLLMAELLKHEGKEGMFDVLSALQKSMALSADVDAGVNPTYKNVHDLKNAAKIGHGIIVTKFTGSGGKYSSNDAHAEYMSFITRLFTEKKVPWQAGELGKVDEGGGGTIAKYISQHGVETVDCGPGVLSMHSPMELSSKADIYASHLAYKAFLESVWD